MPSRIVIALEEPDFADAVRDTLAAEGHSAASFPDSLCALHALEAAVQTELLITCLQHASGKPNGISLALMARRKRPMTRVLFVGEPRFASYTEGVGGLHAVPGDGPGGCANRHPSAEHAT
jgi:hypothetical protein